MVIGMNKAIVVGGAGFVGSAVVRELLSRGVEVTVVDRPSSGFENINNSRLSGLDVLTAHCDINNISALKELLPNKNYDVWYQFAWEGLFNEPLLDYDVQINNIKYVMDAVVVAKELGCSKFIGAGSISQYELRTLEGQVNEHDKHRVYKTAKLACEYMGRSVASGENIAFFWPIITNIFGEGETSPRLINSMIRKLLAGGRQSLSEGNQIYDFIHVSDAARAFSDIGERGVENRTYVIGSGGAKPLKEFLLELRDIVNPDAELGFGEMNFNGIYLPAEDYDVTPLSNDTGFKPKLTFADGIKRTKDWIAGQ
jgi:nucleoside-diphosphate-sugar epimerase